MSRIPIRRSTPWPLPRGDALTTLRHGVPWTELTGTISPEILRAARLVYLHLGGGPIWAVDCDRAIGYTSGAIECALINMKQAHLSGRLGTMIASIPADIVRMAAASLRMRLAAESVRVRLVVVGSVTHIPTEIARVQRGGIR